MLARHLRSVPHDSTPAAFDPINDITWAHVYWADDPNWTDPGNGNTVASWDDPAGGDPLTTSTEANKPIFRSSTTAFNSKATLEFDGTNDRLSVAAVDWPNLTGSVTFAIVVRSNETGAVTENFFDGHQSTNRRSVFYRSDGTWGAMAGGTTISGGTNDTSPHLFVFESVSGSDTLYVDNTSTATGDSGNDDFQGFIVGARYDLANFLDGDIAFIGVYDGAMSSGDRGDLWTWAQSYYDL